MLILKKKSADDQKNCEIAKHSKEPCTMYFRDSERESTSRQDSIQEPDEKLGTCEMTVKALRNIIAYCILPPKGRLIIFFI